MKELFKEEFIKIQTEVARFEENFEKCEKEIEEERKKIIEILKDIVVLERGIGMYHQIGAERYVNYVENEDKIWLKEFLNTAIEYFMDPDEVEDISMLHYFTLNLHGYEAFRYLLTLYGVCSLLYGVEGLTVFEEIQRIYTPLYDIDAEMDLEEELEKISLIEDLNKEEVTNLYESGLIPLLSREQYFVTTMTDYALKTIDDYFMCKILRGLDEKQGALLMRGLSNKAAEKVRKNITRRLEVAIDEELETMEGAKVEDIVNAIRQIFNQMTIQIQEGK